ncbi:hypothetical protein [Paraburkholderia aromaticivorans]|uniref:Uncharacterized protein n=1 Tax=Paraburkholderia aromaticivorans TaxID=2026199 RepID=A0A248VWR3_9BURK|nr:hypothetical protein [Paraburkholderia aromaticivorans]ASW03474.1 hypothetical protein CJU94_35475 [Paraburkholderia aromaticivorans]
MSKEIRSAKEIQQLINTKLEAAGLGPAYRVGLPARLVPTAPDGHNWHFIDVLTGGVEEMTAVTAALSDARRQYVMEDA